MNRALVWTVGAGMGKVFVRCESDGEDVCFRKAGSASQCGNLTVPGNRPSKRTVKSVACKEMCTM